MDSVCRCWVILNHDSAVHVSWLVPGKYTDEVPEGE